MNLSDALTLLAERLNLSAEDLIGYAAEDTQGGRGHGFSPWAIDVDEGKLLYALVRGLKPPTLLEIGTHEGASASHLLAAAAANGAGEVVSYDTHPEAGRLIPGELLDQWAFQNEDAQTADLPPADFVFEDGGHGLEFTTAVFTQLKEHAPRVLVTHDVNMTTEHGDFHVAEVFEQVFPDGLTLTLDGCERGLGVWINSEWQASAEEAPKPAPTRKPTPRTRATKAKK